MIQDLTKALFVPVLALVLALPVKAQEAVGVWKLDVAHWQAQMESLIDRALGGVPPEQLEMMRAQGIDPQAMMREVVAGNMGGDLEIEADGAARAVADDGSISAGSWTPAGDAIAIRFSDDDVTFLGSIEGDTLTMRPDPDNLDAETKALMDGLSMILHRQ